VLTADQVARALVRGIERRQLYILPNFESWLYFRLANGFIGFYHWYVDRVIAQVRRERLQQTNRRQR
jgi:hypothetical protein